MAGNFIVTALEGNCKDRKRVVYYFLRIPEGCSDEGGVSMSPEAPAVRQTEPDSSRSHRRRFSRLGLGLAACAAVQYVLWLGISVGLDALNAWGILQADLVINAVSFQVVYYILTALMGLLAFWMIARPVPFLLPEQRRPLPPLSFLKVYFVAAAVLFLGSYFTDLLLSLIAALRGAPIVDPVNDFFEMPIPVLVLLTCVVAPVVEELTYRRLLLPRLRPYGDRFAVLASALCFSLMHGNLSQFFYAFALGIVLGRVFLKTGCIWQTILLHALVNLVGGVVPTLAASYGAAGEEFYLRFTLCLIGAGAFCFLHRARDTVYAPGIYPLGEGRKWRLFFLNLGMVCFCLLCLIQAALYLME